MLPPSIHNSVFPVVRATRRANTIEVKRECLLQGDREGAPIRGKINRLSSASRSRLAFVASETEVKLRSLLTLSYPNRYPRDGKLVKGMLNRFLTWLRRAVDDISYLWFLEFQRRGAPHIHLMLSVRYSRKLHYSIASQWAVICGAWLELSTLEADKVLRQHRRRRNFENIRHPDGAKRYAIKYATKTYQKTVPENYQNVGRFWGASRDVVASIPKGMQFDVTEDELRQYLAYHGLRGGEMSVLPKIIYI